MSNNLYVIQSYKTNQIYVLIVSGVPLDVTAVTRFSSQLHSIYLIFTTLTSTVVKVLCYKSEGRWFDPS